VNHEQEESAMALAERQQTWETRLHIGGEEVEARRGGTYAVTSPATGRHVATVADADREDVDWAATAAADSFESGVWRRRTAAARAAALYRVADLLMERQEELALMDCLCSGKPIRDCRAEVGSAARYFRFYAGIVPLMTGSTIPVNASGLDFTLREPIGVCALIVPWNGPLAIAAKKAAPALAAGNSVVLKPAPATPLTALELERCAREAEIPSGVFNVLTGGSVELGRALVAHPRVDKISFTGSTRTGRDILKNAADGIKRVSLELGGKSPNIVFADSDLDEVVESAAWAVYWNCGQDCCARSRAIVERPVHEAFVERLAARGSRMRVADPLLPDTEIGSLISAGQRERVLGFIERAKESGAELHGGGQVVVVDGLEAGNAISPAVIAGVDPASEIAREEVFGPVATVIPFDTEEEAIALANGTPYGLSGSLWTRDIGRAVRVAREVRSGLLSINSDSSSYLEAPFGGRKQSGIGREQGLEGLYDFTELKNVYVSDV
jgi:acyl-CoA reductase-like NAD-dependent aldehyde dehydrogenase